jgi:hypothetical protein
MKINLFTSEQVVNILSFYDLLSINFNRMFCIILFCGFLISSVGLFHITQKHKPTYSKKKQFVVQMLIYSIFTVAIVMIGYLNYISPISSYNLLRDQQKYIYSLIEKQNFSKQTKQDIYNKLIIDDIDYKIEFSGTKLISNKYKFDDEREYLYFTVDVLCRLNLSKSCTKIYIADRANNNYNEAVNQNAIDITILYAREKQL